MADISIDDLLKRLRAAEEAVRQARAAQLALELAIAKAHRRCHTCGATDEDNEEAGYGPLIDINVIVSNGEEGHADPLRFFCQDHVVPVLDALIVLGFGVHRHGGINQLEPTDCPGYRKLDECPTPVTTDADGNRWD